MSLISVRRLHKSHDIRLVTEEPATPLQVASDLASLLTSERLGSFGSERGPYHDGSEIAYVTSEGGAVRWLRVMPTDSRTMRYYVVRAFFASAREEDAVFGVLENVVLKKGRFYSFA